MERKEVCLEAVRQIIALANHARREGLLSLEDFARGYNDPFVTFLVMMTADGADNRLIKTCGEGYISYKAEFENAPPFELLRLRVILRGVLGILHGENPHNIEVILLAMCGVLKQYDFMEIGKIDELPETGFESPVLDEIASLNGHQIQMLLRSCDFDDNDLMVFLCGADNTVRKAVLENISVRKAFMLIDAMEHMAQVRKVDFEEAAAKIADVIKKHRKKGLIDV
jgi:hypothetical protein